MIRRLLIIGLLVGCAPMVHAGPVRLQPSVMSATGTADTGIGVTVTLPSETGSCHYITWVQIVKYLTGVITASATPVIVTTTNMNNINFYFRNVGILADSEIQGFCLANTLKSTTQGVNTTIVCPAVTSVRWHVTVLYYLAP